MRVEDVRSSFCVVCVNGVLHRVAAGFLDGVLTIFLGVSTGCGRGLGIDEAGALLA